MRNKTPTAQRTEQLGTTMGPAAGTAALSTGKRKSHIESSIVLYVFIATVIAVGAVNSQNNLLFAAFGLAIGVVVVSGLVSGPALMSLEIARLRPAEARPGEPLTLVYRVHNRSRFLPAFAVQITELGAGLKNATDPDRVPTKHSKRPIGFVTHIGPGQTIQAKAMLWPARRGEHALTGVRLMTRFPFGILRKSIDVQLPGKLTVLPLVLPMRDGVRQSLGLHRTRTATTSHTAGGTDEFFGVREYRAGDPLRTVAWKASARANQLRIIQRSRSTSDRLALVLDLSGIDPKKDSQRAERAICLLASVATDRIGAAGAVSLAVPTHGISLRSGSGSGQLHRILSTLATLDIHHKDITAPRNLTLNDQSYHFDSDPAIRISARSGGVTDAARDLAQLDATVSFDTLLDTDKVPEALVETVGASAQLPPASRRSA